MIPIPFHFSLPTGIFTLLFPAVLWKMEKRENEKNIYITIDDGPHPKTTPFFLEYLKKYDMEATFFLKGVNIEKYYPWALEIKKEHSIGNHGYAHLNGWQTSTKKYVKDIKKAEEVLQIYLNIKTKLFRPPFGKISISQFFFLKKQYQIVLWSVMSHDFAEYSSFMILEKLKKYTFPGAIIVFHDNEKAHAKLPLLFSHYLRFLKENGYKAKKIIE